MNFLEKVVFRGLLFPLILLCLAGEWFIERLTEAGKWWKDQIWEWRYGGR